jgi:hypothetical protein
MQRRNDLDALRGLLLLLMAVTHLPTRLSAYSNQPFGFVGAAEGFVFLSAFTAGNSYLPQLLERGAQHVRSRLWTRALKLYGYHVALLLFAFTVAAAFAALSGRPALRNLLSFYFDSPTVAIVGGPLLLYQPPLFDILPMYIIFLALTPLLLEVTSKRGWRGLLCVSLLVWVVAQFDGHRLLHEALCNVTGLPIPLDAAGSFDLLAWQLLWITGLWAGTRYVQSVTRRHASSVPIMSLAFAVVIVFFVWRHRIGGFWIELGAYSLFLDKWHLGFLRVVNFAALALIVSHAVLPLLAWLRVSVLSLLGRASLQAFSVHVLLCMASLGLIVDDETPLNSGEEALVLLLTLSVMFWVAWKAAPGRAARR